MSKQIDYVRLNEALLERVDRLLANWLPNGEENNGRWYVGDFDGSPGKSANVNMDTGQWIDNGYEGDKGGDLISLYARINNLNNAKAAQRLMEELGWADRDYDPPPPRASREDRVQASAQPPQADEIPPAPAEEGVRPERKKQRWTPIVPVPSHAPDPRVFRFGYKDKTKGGAWIEQLATRAWRYELDGRLYGFVARFERVSSEGDLVKDTLPYTWCIDNTDDRGLCQWHWKQWDAPRPLYVPATSLRADEARPVVVVEGEKCAEAGHERLGSEFDFVSWPGGCKVWSYANWSLLQGRTVYLWPDADAQHERLSAKEKADGIDPSTKPLLPLAKQPGYRAMVDVGTKLQADYGCTVYICLRIGKPGDRPPGWDIADAIDDGWNDEQLRDFIRAAAPFSSTNDEARAKAAATPSEAGAGDDGEADGWRSKLFTSGSGSIKACRENVVLACDGVPELRLPGDERLQGVIAFNEFTNEVMKLKEPPWGTEAGRWLEEDELELGNWLSRELWLPPMPRGTLEEAVLMIAKRHKYHPVRQQLEGLRGSWDGTPRLATWLRRVCMVEDEYDDNEPLQQYLARAGTWFVMAMCARVLPELRKPNGELYQGKGSKFDYMLVLEGKQGWGKSTVPKVLAGDDFFADTGLILGEKDSYQNIQGIWLYEWGELDSMAKAEVTKVKQFVASPKDRFRATFDRRPKDYPRQVVFVGTTNEDHYLTDLTGNRRFWPVKLQQPADLAWLRANRAQLLAEALMLLDRGDRYFPTPAEQRALFDPQQGQRVVENSVDSAIRAYLYDEEQRPPMNGIKGTQVSRISLKDLLDRIHYPIDKQTPNVVKQASSALARLGWEIGSRAGEQADGMRPRLYHRPAPPRSERVEHGASHSQSRPAQGAFTAEASDGCPV